VCIVGGGSSGWMTAASLAKLCPHLDVVLVESKSVGTVGVGESTLGHINRFLKMLDITDEMWMADCNATYKNSIRFTSFRENNNEVFEYPFCHGFDSTFGKENGLETWNELSALYPDIFTPETFAEFHALSNTTLATYNKQTRNEEKKLKFFDFGLDTAYHMDAQLFGEWLKNNIALPNGVKHITGNVINFADDGKGKLFKLFVDSGDEIGADLFIDCTGFRSLLLEKIMGAQFISFEDYLANDRAWAVRLPYSNREEQMHNVTDCHALGNGWVWNIPLWNRIGTGYVYSSRFIDDDGALKEFKNHLNEKHDVDLEEAKFFPVQIRHGKRTRAWIGNVVGIGLSYGFVEPLESTGLLTTHENIIRLVDMLNTRGGYLTRSEREAFNKAADTDIEGFKQFVSMHYALSKRNDTAYWRWATQKNEYEPLQFNDFQSSRYDYKDILGPIIGNLAMNDRYHGNNFIIAGMGMRSISTVGLIKARYNYDRLSELEKIKNEFLHKRDSVRQYVSALPTHYQYLKENIYNNIDNYDV